MALVESDLENAEMHFANAIENDPTIPIVRNNIGFCLIARGEFGAASKIFKEVVDDGRASEESPRDVWLARVGAAFVKYNKAGAADADVLNDYSDLLKADGLPDFIHIRPPVLRLSYMHLAIGKKLGADVRYFALEFLAAIHLALSSFEADEARRGGGPQPLSDRIIKEALGLLSKLRIQHLRAASERSSESALFQPLLRYFHQSEIAG